VDPKTPCACTDIDSPVFGRLRVHHTAGGHDIEMQRLGPLWARGLSHWGREIVVRACQAATRRAEESWKDGLPLSYEEGGAWADVQTTEIAAQLTRIDAWLECPCDTHLRTATAGALTMGDNAPVLRIAACVILTCEAIWDDDPGRNATNVFAEASQIANTDLVRDVVLQVLIAHALR